MNFLCGSQYTLSSLLPKENSLISPIAGVFGRHLGTAQLVQRVAHNASDSTH